ATAADYAKTTGKPASAPGHATYKTDGKAVVSRRLDLRADEPNLLAGVLAHETAHLVLGDLFADGPPPRWADEGMAVLTEPRAQLDRYVRALHRCRNVERKLVPLSQIFQMAEYPDAAAITVFYVQSVSVVEFLVAERDGPTFVQFVRDAQRGPVDAALK